MPHAPLPLLLPLCCHSQHDRARWLHLKKSNVFEGATQGKHVTHGTMMCHAIAHGCRCMHVDQQDPPDFFRFRWLTSSLSSRTILRAFWDFLHVQMRYLIDIKHVTAVAACREALSLARHRTASSGAWKTAGTSGALQTDFRHPPRRRCRLPHSSRRACGCVCKPMPVSPPAACRRQEPRTGETHCIPCADELVADVTWPVTGTALAPSSIAALWRSVHFMARANCSSRNAYLISMALVMQRLLVAQAVAATALVQRLSPAVALSGRRVSELLSLENFAPASSSFGVRFNHQSSFQAPVDPQKLRNFAVIGAFKHSRLLIGMHANVHGGCRTLQSCATKSRAPSKTLWIVQPIG